MAWAELHDKRISVSYHPKNGWKHKIFTFVFHTTKLLNIKKLTLFMKQLMFPPLEAKYKSLLASASSCYCTCSKYVFIKTPGKFPVPKSIFDLLLS